MIKNQISKRNGVEDFLCPFTDVYITQGSGEGNHLDTKAIDVRGLTSGVKYPYYAPCSCRCIKTLPSNGQSEWTSLEKVRLSTGLIDYVTFLIAHDNTIDAYVGQIISQGVQIGNLGDMGYATGVHCHFEVAIGEELSLIKLNNIYNTWTYPIEKEIEVENAFFMDNTNIIHGYGNWKYLSDVAVETKSDVLDEVDVNPEDDKSENKENENSNFDKLILLKKITLDGMYAVTLNEGEELYIKTAGDK